VSCLKTEQHSKNKYEEYDTFIVHGILRIALVLSAKIEKELPFDVDCLLYVRLTNAKSAR